MRLAIIECKDGQNHLLLERAELVIGNRGLHVTIFRLTGCCSNHLIWSMLIGKAMADRASHRDVSSNLLGWSGEHYTLL
jgi:hypothetical protein